MVPRIENCSRLCAVSGISKLVEEKKKEKGRLKLNTLRVCAEVLKCPIAGVKTVGVCCR